MKIRITAIALVPSTYGFLGWIGAFALFEYRHVPWYETTIELYLAFLVQALFFLLSILVHYASARQLIRQCVNFDGSLTRTVFKLYFLHLIGIFGVSLYVWDFSSGFGGVSGFFATYFSEAFRIRQFAEQQSSVGVQLSYFGWVAIVLSPIVFRHADIRKRSYLIATSTVQYAANFLFIDRTRPIWILMMLLMVCGWAYRDRLSLGQMLKMAALIPLSVFGIFGFVGTFVGKIDGGGGLWSVADSAYYYVTSGFAYLNYIISYEKVVEMSFVRTLAPLVNFFSFLGFAEPAPSTILPFYDVPVATNVGTSLEPFFRDGGYLYLIFGAFVGSFVLDAIALVCLRAKTIFSVYFWACAVFISATSFFVQKLGNLSVWIFLFCAFVSIIVVSIRTQSLRVSAPI